MQIALVKRVMFVVERVNNRQAQICVMGLATTLGTAGLEFVDRYASGDAKLALRTVWAIDIVAAAAKSLGDEPGIAFAAHLKRRIDVGVACTTIRQVAAGVFRTQIKLDALQAAHVLIVRPWTRDFSSFLNTDNVLVMLLIRIN